MALESPAARESSPRLDGWKSIADYLGRDVRTAHRWHRDRGMPVHHVPGGRRAAVFADRNELDGWLRQADSGQDGPKEATSAGPLSEDHKLPGASHAFVTRRHWWGSRRSYAVAAGATFVILSTVGLNWSRPKPEPPARIELKGDALLASDSADRTLWSHQLATVDVEKGGNRPRPELFETVPADLDGDGTAEVLSFVRFRTPGNPGTFLREEIYCLSADGRLLWTYTPDRRLSFAGREFSGPWRIRAWETSRSAERRVWISYIHERWWPSFVVSLDVNGVARLVLVNSGHVEALREVTLDGRSYVLASGINNEYRSAAIALVDPRQDGVTSPQSVASAFACDTCPSGHPTRYILLPRSELNIAFGQAYNLADVLSSAAGRAIVEVGVRENGEPMLRSFYKLTATLLPQSVWMSDRYWEHHRHLSEEGKIGHSFETCPERLQGVLGRVWASAEGWRDVRIPPLYPPEMPAPF